MGKIVTLGEVVADVYRGDAASEVELPFTARPGGAPANVAVAAAKLGAEAAFVGRLGDDLFGDFIFRALEAVGVDTSAVLRQPPPTRTTLAFVEVAPDGDREFTFYRSVPAADELLSPDDIKHEALADASFANFGSVPLIQDPASSATRRVAEVAIEMGVPVAFDVNLRERLWENTEAAREQISPMLDLATVAKLSDDELPPVLGVQSPEEAADALLDRGVALALVSMGGEGAFYATQRSAAPCRGSRSTTRASWTPRARGTRSWPPFSSTSPKAPAGSPMRPRCARRSAGGRRPGPWPARTSVPCAPSPRGKTWSASWPLEVARGRSLENDSAEERGRFGRVSAAHDMTKGRQGHG